MGIAPILFLLMFACIKCNKVSTYYKCVENMVSWFDYDHETAAHSCQIRLRGRVESGHWVSFDLPPTTTTATTTTTTTTKTTTTTITDQAKSTSQSPITNRQAPTTAHHSLTAALSSPSPPSIFHQYHACVELLVNQSMINQ